MHTTTIRGIASRKIYCFVILSIICIYEVPIYNRNRGYEFRERMRIFGTGDTNFFSHFFLQS
jgi:hypothetical protein